MAWSFMRDCTALRVTNLSRRKRRKCKVLELTFSLEASATLCKSWKENAAGSSSLVLTAVLGREWLCQQLSLWSGLSHASIPMGSCFVNVHAVFRKKCCFFWQRRCSHMGKEANQRSCSLSVGGRLISSHRCHSGASPCPARGHLLRRGRGFIYLFIYWFLDHLFLITFYYVVIYYYV